MKKSFIAVLLLSASVGANAVDFSSNFSTGTKQVKTTGDMKITGESTKFSKVELSGLQSDYAISVAPCSDCSTAVGEINDYKAVGDYKAWSKSITKLDITNKVDNTANGVICKVDLELGALNLGNSTERMSEVNNNIMVNNSITGVSGGDKYVGKVYDSGKLVGTIVEGSNYLQHIQNNLTTVTTEKLDTFKVASYIGN